MKQLDDPIPFIRGIVEFGYKRKEIEYEQPQRKAGRTHNNWYSLYDAAMLSITSYTKVGLRLATFGGFISSFLCLGIALIYFVFKLCNWNSFQPGIAPIIIGVFLMGSIQLFFIGLLGEYIMNINTRVMHRPLVVEGGLILVKTLLRKFKMFRKKRFSKLKDNEKKNQNLYMVLLFVSIICFAFLYYNRAATSGRDQIIFALC